MHLEFELDKVLRRHNLGNANFWNIYNLRIWRDENLKYVTIGVPYRLNHRFQKFWGKAVERFGLELEVYFIQHGVPMNDCITDLETLYFINKDSASKMLRDFYEIMIPELND